MQLKIGGMSIGATDPKQLERIQQGLDPEDEAKGLTPKSMPHPDPQTREAIGRYVTEHRGMDSAWKPAESDVAAFRNAGYTDVNLGHFQQ